MLGTNRYEIQELLTVEFLRNLRRGPREKQRTDSDRKQLCCQRVPRESTVSLSSSPSGQLHDHRWYLLPTKSPIYLGRRSVKLSLVTQKVYASELAPREVSAGGAV